MRARKSVRSGVLGTTWGRGVQRRGHPGAPQGEEEVEAAGFLQAASTPPPHS